MLRRCTPCLARVWRCDDGLVALPPGVRRCEVYRNVVTLDEEEAIYAELSRIMEREGQTVLEEGSTAANKVVRHTYMEMYGLTQTFTEVKSWRKREVRRLPGMVWSPTLLRLLRTVPRHIMGMDCPHYARSAHVTHSPTTPLDHTDSVGDASTAEGVSTGGTTRADDGTLPDMARVVEHNLPGYEMHMEHPSTGLGFLYINLLADTVLDFDDECSQRRGQVYVPARSMMAVSHEARWGFRFGEAPRSVHYFAAKQQQLRTQPRRVETDLRLSVQVWKLRPHLLDARVLQERMEQSMTAYLEGRSNRARGAMPASEADSESGPDVRDTGCHGENEERSTMGGSSSPRARQDDDYTPLPSPAALETATTVRGRAGGESVASSLVGESLETTHGKGVLGGDYVSGHTRLRTDASASVRGAAKVTLGDVATDYAGYKRQFNQVHGILQEMKAMHDAGQPVNDVWYRKKLAETSGADLTAERANGFDADNLEATWDGADAKARFYKAKLRTMDYDGTAFAHSSMPDLSNEVPLEMRSTIRKIAPLVKDGEKILASLPGGDAVRRGAG